MYLLIWIWQRIVRNVIFLSLIHISFKFSSAAKTVHHGFVGGLLEHTLSVTKLCDYYVHTYPMLNADLLYACLLYTSRCV